MTAIVYALRWLHRNLDLVLYEEYKFSRRESEFEDCAAKRESASIPPHRDQADLMLIHSTRRKAFRE